MIYEGMHYSSSVTARFADDYIVIDSSAGVSAGDATKPSKGATTDMILKGAPALHVKAISGQQHGEDWTALLQVASATHEGMWIDSSDGWVKVKSSEPGWVRFVDMGDHYELWQGKNKDRPLINSDGRLRFAAGMTPGRFNIKV
ncbi:hypothetical protein [Streptomyces sp. NPDC096324]|uniref:hypothetical protein n=1 Tax=Streptomyces sp. NPDC096324 TaxID=3366085 RepID=UPI00380712B2